MKLALLSAAFWTAAVALAGPPLTTIQDTLYKADGTRFNGILQIQWTSFEASDRSQIATQSLTLRVVDGILRVRLVPTINATPPARYSVSYNSDGRVQFREWWAVPSTAATLRVREVRVSTGSNPPVSDAITLTEVEGLAAELTARPVKGSAYAPRRTARINDAGELESVLGSSSDCVRVDGTSGPCGHPPAFVDGEVPAGLVDGSNAVFALSAAPLPAASLQLYRNGIRQKADFDYALSGNTVEFVSGAVPQPGDTLLSSYRVDTSEAVSLPFSVPGPEVLCSAEGSASSSETATTLGECEVAELVSGDRIVAMFDYSGPPGHSLAIVWDELTLVSGQDVTSGRVELAAHSGGTQWNSLLWNSGAPAGSAGTSVGRSGVLQFRGSGNAKLRGYTVIKYPARAH